MAFAAIVGAGDLGGAVAHRLARLDCVGEIRLVDDAADVAAGKALDLRPSAAVDGFVTRLVATADPRAAAGAAVVVIADAAGPPAAEWQGEAALALVERLWRLVEADRSVLVCAGASHRWLVERAVRELGVDRRRIVGSAPAALESAAQALVGAAADVAPARVAVRVLGVPPDGMVVAWSQAAVGGVAASARLAPERLRALDRQIAAAWPPGPAALGAAAARVAAALVVGSRREHTCFVAVERPSGGLGPVLALPARLEPDGVREAALPPLSTHEQVRLENALASLAAR